MLAINNYLIIGVNPANSETQVPVNKEIVITFSKHMDEASLTSSNLTLRVVNGDVVPIAIAYSSLNMTVKIAPNYSTQLGMPAQALQSGTQYELVISGGATGVKSVTGDYMTVSRTYEFTTSSISTVTQPLDITVTTDSGYPTVTWMKPKDYDVSSPVTYEVMISTSNDPLNPPVWPSTGDINAIASTILNIPKKLTEGTYYAYIRAINGSSTSEWASQQFFVSAPAVNPNPSQPSGGGGDIFSFDVVDTYPRRDDVDITPEQIIIIFSSDIDPTTVTADTVYIINKADKQNLSLIDFMTNYAPSKKVAATLEPITVPNMITLTAVLDNDAEYTVIVRETVKNDSGASLGTAYHWSFVTEYTRLYGDPALVRQDIGSISSSTSDKVLYKYLDDSTKYAFQVVSNASTFIAGNYNDGKAPYEVHQYVRYRTAYAVLLNSQLHSGSGGAFTKEVKLGDLTVMQSPAAGGGSTSSAISDLQDKMKIYMDMIQGHHNRGYAKPQVVIRGENAQPEPTFITRTEFKDLGQ